MLCRSHFPKVPTSHPLMASEHLHCFTAEGLVLKFIKNWRDQIFPRRENVSIAFAVVGTPYFRQQWRLLNTLPLLYGWLLVREESRYAVA